MVRLRANRRFHLDTLIEAGDVLEVSTERAARLLRSYSKYVEVESVEPVLADVAVGPEPLAPEVIEAIEAVSGPMAEAPRRRRGRPRKNW